MSSPSSLHVGVFSNPKAAERAVKSLIDAGFQSPQISVVCPSCGERDLAGVKKVDPAGSHTPEAVLTGGAVGALLGSFSLLAGTAATGGMGLLVAGPLLGAAGAGGLAGGFVGAMATRGLEPEIADYYDQALRDGQVLVAVERSEQAAPSLERADELLRAAGAKPIELEQG